MALFAIQVLYRPPKQKATAKAVAFCFGFQPPKAASTLQVQNSPLVVPGCVHIIRSALLLLASELLLHQQLVHIGTGS